MELFNATVVQPHPESPRFQVVARRGDICVDVLPSASLLKLGASALCSDWPLVKAEELVNALQAAIDATKAAQAEKQAAADAEAAQAAAIIAAEEAKANAASDMRKRVGDLIHEAVCGDESVKGKTLLGYHDEVADFVISRMRFNE